MKWDYEDLEQYRITRRVGDMRVQVRSRAVCAWHGDRGRMAKAGLVRHPAVRMYGGIQFENL